MKKLLGLSGALLLQLIVNARSEQATQTTKAAFAVNGLH